MITHPSTPPGTLFSMQTAEWSSVSVVWLIVQIPVVGSNVPEHWVSPLPAPAELDELTSWAATPEEINPKTNPSAPTIESSCLRIAGPLLVSPARSGARAHPAELSRRLLSV